MHACGRTKSARPPPNAPPPRLTNHTHAISPYLFHSWHLFFDTDKFQDIISIPNLDSFWISSREKHIITNSVPDSIDFFLDFFSSSLSSFSLCHPFCTSRTARVLVLNARARFRPKNPGIEKWYCLQKAEERRACVCVCAHPRLLLYAVLQRRALRGEARLGIQGRGRQVLVCAYGTQLTLIVCVFIWPWGCFTLPVVLPFRSFCPSGRFAHLRGKRDLGNALGYARGCVCFGGFKVFYAL